MHCYLLGQKNVDDVEIEGGEGRHSVLEYLKIIITLSNNNTNKVKDIR